VPYINARLFDTNLLSWDKEGKPNAVKEHSLPLPPPPLHPSLPPPPPPPTPPPSPFFSLPLLHQEEKYSSHAKLGVMCPFTFYWQEKIAGLLFLLRGGFGVCLVVVILVFVLLWWFWC